MPLTVIKLFHQVEMSYFGQNGKPIALLFGENRSLLDAFNIHKNFFKFENELFLQKW